MKRWLSYILMAVLCSLYLSSCAKDEEVAKATDGGKVPVRLTLAFSNFGGRAASEPGDLDYTTVEQSAMTADDVYVLVVDANDNFLYQVQDLKLGNPVEGDNYYTRQLEGTMLRTVGGEQVKLVVLANLKDNKIASYTTGAAIRNFLETKKGSNIAKVYKELVYHYGGSTIPWKLAERAIPMWGSSNLTAVPGTGVDLACNLYRAVAKVGIWVNMQDGYQGFTITKIIVNNANDKGYCVSTETPNPVETVQYIYPSIPAGAQNQTITYDGLQVTTAYENEIYLPEKVNTTGGNEISLTVHYTYHNKAKVGTIKFRTNGDGDIFDVIRNHSYLFNIKLSTIEIDAELQYQVMDWTEVDNGELDFGDGGGDVRNNLWRILYMKNKLKYMALCLSLLIGVGACSEEEIAYSAGEENKEVILQLNCQLQTNQEVIVSRASTAENRLNDLHFYVFNAAGRTRQDIKSWWLQSRVLYRLPDRKPLL